MDALLKIMATTLAINQTDNNHNRLVRPQNILNTYDYIVVGAGGAGAVVAARLAEDMSKTVLLLEAGGPQTHEMDAPGLQRVVANNAIYEWNYPMIRQRNGYNAFIAGVPALPFPSGKGFGGSTMHNNMNYWYEREENFSLYQSLYGTKNWTFADVLPFFLKSENNLDKNIVKLYPKYHRTGGPLSVSTADPPDLMLRRYVDIAMKYGADYTFSDGRNRTGFGGNSGVTVMQRTIANGTRQSTSTAFLERDIKPNLTTIGFAFVTKVLFDSNKRAIGVKFRCNNTGILSTVYTTREIILSAGAIGSVKLLLLSGIGPAEHLRSINIPIVANVRGVGSQMNYHLGLSLSYDIINQTEIPKPIQTVDNMYDYYVHRKGPLTYLAAGMHCLKISHLQTSLNEEEMCISPRILQLSDEINVSFYKRSDDWNDYYQPYLGHLVFNVVTMGPRVQNNGTIRLQSDNPFDNPLTDPCVYGERKHLEDSIKLFQSSLVFLENRDIQRYIRRFEKPVPGCTPCASDWYCYEYVKCILLNVSGPLFPCGTNRIGDTVRDPDAVVDNRLRVRGVSGLRVVDYSVIPVSGLGQPGAIMIGGRGAQLIKEDNKQ